MRFLQARKLNANDIKTINFHSESDIKTIVGGVVELVKPSLNGTHNRYGIGYCSSEYVFVRFKKNVYYYFDSFKIQIPLLTNRTKNEIVKLV